MAIDTSIVVQALSSIRSAVVNDEYNLHNTVADHLAAAAIPFKREYKLGPRNRIDFLIENGIGIEVKKGKQNKAAVLQQVERYARCEETTAIILVSEYNLQLPKLVNGKECITIFLNRLWGIAL